MTRYPVCRAGAGLAGCGGSNDNGQASPPLAVVPTTPANAAVGVLNTAEVSATFDQAIDPATPKNANFSVNCPTGADAFGSVTYDAVTKKATFARVIESPTNLPQSEVAEPVAANVTCTATIATGVKDTVENVNGKATLTRVGITCALCHSTVDNSFAPGIDVTSRTIIRPLDEQMRM